MATSEKKSLNSPDETRPFEKGKVELINIGSGTVGRATFQPGWKWSQHVKPISKTDWCEAPHFLYSISGRARVHMEDGTEFDIAPGDVAVIPSGHDAWVVGNEPWVNVDWSGLAEYAKPR
ncbi:MAG: cupin [Chloroflexi bacterium RBG_16_68_14]|nr:MAG: cupin [Chloroflexi bacterium RBG_16_68_14]